VIVVLLMSVFAVLSLSLVSANVATGKEHRQLRDSLAARCASEAGIGAAFFNLESGGTGNLGGEEAPETLGSDTYWVQASDLGDGYVSLSSTGRSNRTETRVELIVLSASSAFFRWGAFGDVSMTIDSNAFFDAYDSSLGSYDDQDVNGNGSSRHASDDGSIGSNGDISLDSNAKVFGGAVPGPGHSTSVTGNAFVTGSTTPADSPTDMPALDIPVFPPSGSLEVGSSDSDSLVSGEYNFATFHLDSNATLDITGPATIVCGDMILDSNAEIHIDATNGPVEFYVVDDFALNSNTLITSLTNTPADVTINLESDNVIDPEVTVDLDEIDFDSNAQLYGTIYAPNAAVDINSNFELFGAIIAHNLHLDSNSRIHYDEALMEAGGGSGNDYETVCWRVRSASAYDQ